MGIEQEVLDVKGKVVLVRSKEELPTEDMVDLSEKLKGLGASEIIFAIADFYDVKVELLDDAQLDHMGLCRKPNRLQGQRKPRAKSRAH